MPDGRSAPPPIPLLAALLGALSHGALAGLHVLARAPDDPGVARAWLEVLVQHPWRSSLALSLLWLALLLGPAPQAGPVQPRAGPVGDRGGGPGVGRSAPGD